LEATMHAYCDADSALGSNARAKALKTLVAVDGSPASIRALKLAIRQMEFTECGSLVLVNVQNFGTLGLAEGAGIMPLAWIEQEEVQAATQALQDAIAACEQAGVAYAARLEQGPVAATIDRVAREENVNNIVMGTRGLSEVRGLILGSVTTQLLHLADAPVTLVR
jgi:nucleotide-binding universal stress UspA family protein